MKDYQELLSLKESSKRRQKKQSTVVKEAVKCLIDNGFTNIEIASLMTADEADVCKVITDRYASLSSSENDKPCKKIKVLEINADMSRDKVLVRTDGHVRAKIPAAIKRSDNYMAIQCLEDGLSYLNYAKVGSNMGHCDPEVDYHTGIDFILYALAELLDEKKI
jgi:hypothetical protein